MKRRIAAGVGLASVLALWLLWPSASHVQLGLPPESERPGRSLRGADPAPLPITWAEPAASTLEKEPPKPMTAAQAEQWLDEAMYESGMVAALMGCPAPELDVPEEPEGMVCFEADLDLYFGPGGLVDARLIEDPDVGYPDDTLDCFRDVLWELSWPELNGHITFGGEWRLRCQQRMSDVYWEMWSERLEEAGNDPMTAPLPMFFQQVYGPDEPELIVEYVAPAWVERSR